MNDDFVFWKLAYDRKVIDKEFLRQAVKCDKTPGGEISLEQYKEICGENFIE